MPERRRCCSSTTWSSPAGRLTLAARAIRAAGAADGAAADARGAVVAADTAGSHHALRTDHPSRDPLGRGGSALACRRGPRLRPRLDLRPPRLGRAAGVAVVRYDAHADRRRDGHLDRPARHLRLLAQLPAPGHLPPRRAVARRHLRRPVPARGGHRRRPRLAHPRRPRPEREGAGRPVPGVRRPARAAARRGPRHLRGHLVLVVRRAHAAAAARRTAGRGRQRAPLGAVRRAPWRRLGDHRRQGRDGRRLVRRADGVDPRARRGAERRRSRSGRVRPLPQPRLLAAVLAGEHRAVRGHDRPRRRDRLHRRDHALAAARLALRRRRGHPRGRRLRRAPPPPR